jgi:branched-chain amino acid transport system substrate-binding protein
MPTGAPRRKFSAAGWLAPVAALGLAACATKAPPPVEAAPPPPPVVEAPPPPPPPAEPNNRVALLVPTSGPNAAVGQSIANAAALAMADLGPQRFRLITINTAGPGGARAAAESALAQGAGLILGPLLAADVRDVAPLARARDVRVLSFSNDVSVAGSGVHVLGWQPAQAVTRVVGFARAQGVTRFAALVPAGEYGQRASAAFLRAASAGGGQVTGVVTYQRAEAQLASAARQVTAFDDRQRAAGATPATRPDGTVVPVQQRMAGVPFEALLVADSGRVANAFARPLAQFGAPPGSARMLGTELWAAEPGLTESAALRGAWFAAIPDGRFVQLAQRYRARFGGTPSRLAAMGYDAVLLAADLGRDWADGAPFPAAGLLTAGGFTGIDGPFRLTASGVTERVFEVRELRAGGAVVVSPAPSGFTAPRVGARPAPEPVG